MDAIQSLIDWANNNDGFLQAVAMLSAVVGVVGAWTMREHRFRREAIARRKVDAVEAAAVGRHQAQAAHDVVKPAHAQPPRLLVLPVTDNTTSEDDDFFADGLTEDIIAGLAKSPWLFVIDSGTSFSFKGKAVEPRLAGAELGVIYVVHGRIRRSGNRLRASFYLIDVEGGAILWSEQFDCETQQMFDMQDKIERRVIGSIEPASLQHQATAASNRTQDLQQWELVMKARYLFWKTSRETTRQARELLEQAIALDPDDSRAWGILAMTHLNEAWHGWTESTEIALKEADNASRQAVRADATDPWAHHTRSAVTGTLRDLDQAEADLHRALSLNPHLAAALGDMTRILAFAGKTEGAIAFAERAIDASPRDPHLGLWYYWIAMVHFVDANYADALPWLDRASAIRPDWSHPRFLRAVCLGWLGRQDDARQTLAETGLEPRTMSLKSLQLTHPFRDPAHLQRYLEGLRRAGWLGGTAIRSTQSA